MKRARPMVAVAGLLLAACGDPDGPTLSVPERGIEGAWLRVEDPYVPATTSPAHADTLFFFPTEARRLALWSRSTTTVDGAGQPHVARSCTLVSYEVSAPRLLLTVSDPVPATLGTCPVLYASRPLGDLATAPPAPVALTAGTRGPGFELLRDGRDRLLVRPLSDDPELRARLTFRFRRLPPMVFELQ